MLSHAHAHVDDADEMRQVQIEETGSLWHKEGIVAIYTGCGKGVSYRGFVRFRRAELSEDLCPDCHTPFELGQLQRLKQEEAERRNR